MLSIKSRIFILAAVASVLIAPNAMFADESGSIGGRPAFPQDGNPRTQSIFIHELSAGETAKDGVRLFNNTNETKTILVYAVDSVPSSGGAFACAQKVDSKSDVGMWAKLTKDEVTLKAGASEVVPFTVTVPKTAEPGEHNGCIVIQEKKTADESQANGGIVLSFRTGLRLAVTVSGEMVRSLAIDSFTTEVTKDSIVMHGAVKNNGNVSIDADVKAVAHNMFGTEYGQKGGQFPVLSHQTSTLNFDVPRPYWGGWYKSSFGVDYDANSGASIGVRTGGQLTHLDGTDVSYFVAPQPGALAIEVLVAIIIVGGIVFIVYRYGFGTKPRSRSTRKHAHPAKKHKK